MAEQRPDLHKFLNDPAFQQDRELFEGVCEAWFTKKQEKARAEAAAENVSIFDKLFGGVK